MYQSRFKSFSHSHITRSHSLVMLLLKAEAKLDYSKLTCDAFLTAGSGCAER